MTILDKIIKDQRKDVSLKKTLIPTQQLEQSVLFNTSTLSLTQTLKHSASGIIAEHKRRSPSKSAINTNLNVSDVVNGYESAGACGISVLTNSKYFSGALDDLIIARASCNIPLLRKEFIIDEYQILEAKAHGADVVLLIAAVLTRAEIKQLSEFAKSLNLEVLLEVHNTTELHKALMPSLDLLGVNNRNLKTFEVNTQTSKDLSTLIPSEFIKISESGIDSTATIQDLQTYGYQGFLIGESFMKSNTPGKSAKTFITQLER